MKYALTKLFPTPQAGYQTSGNEVLEEGDFDTEKKAIDFFRTKEIPLNENGYCKIGLDSFVVGQTSLKY